MLVGSIFLRWLEVLLSGYGHKNVSGRRGEEPKLDAWFFHPDSQERPSNFPGQASPLGNGTAMLCCPFRGSCVVWRHLKMQPQYFSLMANLTCMFPGTLSDSLFATLLPPPQGLGLRSQCLQATSWAPRVLSIPGSQKPPPLSHPQSSSVLQPFSH